MAGFFCGHRAWEGDPAQEVQGCEASKTLLLPSESRHGWAGWKVGLLTSSQEAGEEKAEDGAGQLARSTASPDHALGWNSPAEELLHLLQGKEPKSRDLSSV